MIGQPVPTVDFVDDRNAGPGVSSVCARPRSCLSMGAKPLFLHYLRQVWDRGNQYSPSSLATRPSSQLGLAPIPRRCRVDYCVSNRSSHAMCARNGTFRDRIDGPAPASPRERADAPPPPWKFRLTAKSGYILPARSGHSIMKLCRNKGRSSEAADDERVSRHPRPGPPPVGKKKLQNDPPMPECSIRPEVVSLCTSWPVGQCERRKRFEW